MIRAATLTLAVCALLTFPPRAVIAAPAGSGSLGLSLEVFVRPADAGRGVSDTELANGEAVRSGDGVQIRVGTREDAYVYVVLYGSTNKALLLHPFPADRASEAWVRAGESRVVPAPGIYLPLDENTGHETVFAIASESPIGSIERFLRRMEKRGDDRDAINQMVRVGYPNAVRFGFRHVAGEAAAAAEEQHGALPMIAQAPAHSPQEMSDPAPSARGTPVADEMRSTTAVQARDDLAAVPRDPVTTPEVLAPEQPVSALGETGVLSGSGNRIPRLVGPAADQPRRPPETYAADPADPEPLGTMSSRVRGWFSGGGAESGMAGAPAGGPEIDAPEVSTATADVEPGLKGAQSFPLPGMDPRGEVEGAGTTDPDSPVGSAVGGGGAADTQRGVLSGVGGLIGGAEPGDEQADASMAVPILAPQPSASVSAPARAFALPSTDGGVETPPALSSLAPSGTSESVSNGPPATGLSGETAPGESGREAMMTGEDGPAAASMPESDLTEAQDSSSPRFPDSVGAAPPEVPVADEGAESAPVDAPEALESAPALPAPNTETATPQWHVVMSSRPKAEPESRPESEPELGTTGSNPPAPSPEVSETAVSTVEGEVSDPSLAKRLGSWFAPNEPGPPEVETTAAPETAATASDSASTAREPSAEAGQQTGTDTPEKPGSGAGDSGTPLAGASVPGDESHQTPDVGAAPSEASREVPPVAAEEESQHQWHVVMSGRTAAERESRVESEPESAAQASHGSVQEVVEQVLPEEGRAPEQASSEPSLEASRVEESMPEPMATDAAVPEEREAQSGLADPPVIEPVEAPSPTVTDTVPSSETVAATADRSEANALGGASSDVEPAQEVQRAPEESVAEASEPAAPVSEVTAEKAETTGWFRSMRSWLGGGEPPKPETKVTPPAHGSLPAIAEGAERETTDAQASREAAVAESADAVLETTSSAPAAVVDEQASDGEEAAEAERERQTVASSVEAMSEVKIASQEERETQRSSTTDQQQEAGDQDKAKGGWLSSVGSWFSRGGGDEETVEATRQAEGEPGPTGPVSGNDDGGGAVDAGRSVEIAEAEGQTVLVAREPTAAGGLVPEAGAGSRRVFITGSRPETQPETAAPPTPVQETAPGKAAGDEVASEESPGLFGRMKRWFTFGDDDDAAPEDSVTRETQVATGGPLPAGPTSRTVGAPGEPKRAGDSAVSNRVLGGEGREISRLLDGPPEETAPAAPSTGVGVSHELASTQSAAAQAAGEVSSNMPVLAMASQAPGGAVTGLPTELPGLPDLTLSSTRALAKIDVLGEDSVAGAVVMVVTPTGRGTGAIVDEQGHVLTNWHTVRDYSHVSVLLKASGSDRPAADSVYVARVVKLSRFSDLALVQIQEPPAGLPVVRLASTKDLAAGQVVHFVGIGPGDVWTHRAGTLARVKAGHSWLSGGKVIHRGPVVEASLVNAPEGGAGAALLNNSRELIGIGAASGKRTGRVLGISVTAIDAFLFGIGTVATAGPAESLSDAPAAGAAQ